MALFHVPGLPGGHLGDEGELLVALRWFESWKFFLSFLVSVVVSDLFISFSFSFLTSLSHLLRQRLKLETELVLDLGVGRVRVDGGEAFFFFEKERVEVEK